MLTAMLRALYLICFGIVYCYCDNEYFRKDYVYIGDQKAFYKAHKIRQNFSEAIATCKAEGTQLMLPSSIEEWTKIIEEAGTASMDVFWVGAHDLFSEGDFITLDGIPIDDVFINWSPGEPNNAGNGENCVTVKRDGFNNDGACEEKKFFVCKRPLKGLTQNKACETYDTEYEFVSELDRCYKFHTVPMNWRDSFKICKAEESNLVEINSQSEADYLIEEFSKHPEISLKGSFEKSLLHVGFNDLIHTGIFLTLSGQLLSESGYEKWGTSQPDNMRGNEHCGSMLRNGELNDADCNLRAMYVCEKALSNV